MRGRSVTGVVSTQRAGRCNRTPLIYVCNSKSVSFGSILSLVSTTGVVEVHLLGDSTVIFALCDSV